MCGALASSGPVSYSRSYFSATLSSSSTADQGYVRLLLPPHVPVPATSSSAVRFQTCSALASAPVWKGNGVLRTSPAPVQDRRSEEKEGDGSLQQAWPGRLPLTSLLPPPARAFGELQSGTTSSPLEEAVPVYRVQGGTPTLRSPAMISLCLEL